MSSWQKQEYLFTSKKISVNLDMNYWANNTAHLNIYLIVLDGGVGTDGIRDSTAWRM